LEHKDRNRQAQELIKTLRLFATRPGRFHVGDGSRGAEISHSPRVRLQQATVLAAVRFYWQGSLRFDAANPFLLHRSSDPHLLQRSGPGDIRKEPELYFAATFRTARWV